MVWSMRLESKAEKLGFDVEEMHNDVRYVLQFSRSYMLAPTSWMRLDESGINLNALGAELKLEANAASLSGFKLDLIGGVYEKQKISMSDIGPDAGVTISSAETELSLRPDFAKLRTGGLSISVPGGDRHYGSKLILDPKDPEIGTYLSGPNGFINLEQTGVRVVNEENGIEIRAKGDIIIRSEKGQVKINGKEIHLNE
jgi:hypothetical protein